MKFLRYILILVLALAIVGLVLWSRHERLARQVNPYAYDIEAFKKTNPKLIGYSETGQIKPNLANPHSIAVDKQGRVYVAGDEAIVITDTRGNEISRIKLSQPANALTVGKDGDILLATKEHVEVYDTNGVKTAEWISFGENAHLTSIAATGNDVFVADYAARLVWHCDASGRLIAQIGAKDIARGALGFIVPSPYFDVACGADGTLWAANPGMQRVEHYSADGKLLGQWGRSGMDIEGFCGCCNPSHIAIAPDGSFVTSEKGLPRIKVYEPDGKFRCVVAGTESFAEGTVSLDLAVDGAGRILVLDPKSGLVRIYEKNS